MTPSAGVVALLAGVFVLPATRDSIEERRNIGFSRWIVILVAVIGFSMMGVGVPMPTDASTAQGGAQSQAGAAATQIAASAPSEQTAAGSTATQPAASSTATRTATVTAASQRPPVHAINESFVVGSGSQQIGYQVYNSYMYETVGSRYTAVEADGEFVVVDIGTVAAGKESVMISSSQFTLVDEQGREYDVDSDALIATQYNIVFEQLDPGVSKAGVLIFDVPED